MSYTKKEQAEAIEALRRYDWTTDGLLIVIKSVSRSGMTRRMHVYSLKDHNYLSYYVARAIGWSMNDKGIKVDGCGMNMTLHLADTLTWAIFGKDKPAGLSGNGGSCISFKSV